MVFMKWDKKHSMGIEEIDSQHKNLIQQVNEFYSISRHEEPGKVIHKLLTDMACGMDAHFRLEEKYFDQFEYEDATAHKLEHRKLTDKISELIERANEGKPIFILEIGNFMKDWLHNHIDTSDQKYRECFKKNLLNKTK